MVRKLSEGPSRVAALPKSSIGRRSEFQMIDEIRSRSEGSARGLVLGIGDDCAVLRQRSGNETVITADLLVEDVDFRLEYTPPELLGHKALAVSLSDIASMGAKARWAMLSVGIPGGLWRSKFLDRFYDGFFELAGRHGVKLIGGDISRTPYGGGVDSIVMGEISEGRGLQRSGGEPGDIGFVTGGLCGAGAGVRKLQEGYP